MNRILSNALEWGVKILYVNGELPWCFFFLYSVFWLFKCVRAVHVFDNLCKCRCDRVRAEEETVHTQPVS